MLLGSGSTENRNLIFNYAIPTGKIQKNNIGTIYQKIKQEFPHLAYGYFNPPKEVQESYFIKRAAL